MDSKKTVYETPAPALDKKKALQTALNQIEKSFGKGAVMRLGDRPVLNIEAVPTGSLALDAALGVGGVPKGRIIEIRACCAAKKSLQKISAGRPHPSAVLP